MVSYIQYPSDNPIRSATVSMTNENSSYPATNTKDDNPINVAKSTTTGTVFTITLASSLQVVGYSLINTNGTSAALTNGAGMVSQALTIPSRFADGQCLNGWKDMTGVANNTSASWTLTVSKTGSAVLEVGEIVFTLAWRTLPWLSTFNGPGVELTDSYPAEIITTFSLSKQKYEKGIRLRGASGLVRKPADSDTVMSLVRSAKGPIVPFLFIPDNSVNDAWYVALSPDTVRRLRQTTKLTPVQIAFEELSMGLPPALT